MVMAMMTSMMMARLTSMMTTMAKENNLQENTLLVDLKSFSRGNTNLFYSRLLSITTYYIHYHLKKVVKYIYIIYELSSHLCPGLYIVCNLF